MTTLELIALSSLELEALRQHYIKKVQIPGIHPDVFDRCIEMITRIEDILIDRQEEITPVDFDPKALCVDTFHVEPMGWWQSMVHNLKNLFKPLPNDVLSFDYVGGGDR